MKALKISMIVSKETGKSIVEDLSSFGVRHHFSEVGRSSILDKNRSFTSFFSRPALLSYPVEFISFFLDDEDDDSVLSYFVKKYDLRTPGKGTIYSQEIEVLNLHNDYRHKQELSFKHKAAESFFDQLMGITCVVQRGQGDRIARIALNYGASVPATTFGEGSGMRDKLGLLRITIPSEKEIVSLVLSKHDADAVMELYIAEGKLDEPGRGISYVYPLKQGIVNTKISRYHVEHAASIEQMVSAIDSLKGGLEWRKSSLEGEAFKRREYLKGLTELNLICEEGYGTPLTDVAMSSGAPGGTICKIRYNRLDEEMQVQRSVRELCKMIVPCSCVEPITQALKESGCFENEAKALLYALPVDTAFTYRAKQISSR